MNSPNTYTDLLFAYSAVWVLIVGYLLTLANRQRCLAKEITEALQRDKKTT